MQKFTIYGKPFGKQRPRFATRGRFSTAYTPPETVHYERAVRTAWLSSCTYEPADAYEVSIVAYYQIPQSATKKRKAEMLAGNILPTIKPDADNIAKVILDGLNGHAFRDDAAIINLSVEKHYSDTPRVEVEVTTIGGEDNGRTPNV